MIFFIIDFFSKKITDLKRSHRKNPRKLKIIFTWITLIILLTVLFYYLGAFSNTDNNYIPLEYKNNVSENESEIFNPLIPKILKESSPVKNSIDSSSFSENVELIPAKNKSSLIDQISNNTTKFKLINNKAPTFKPSKISKIKENITGNNFYSKNLENNLFRNVKTSNNSETKIIDDVLLNLRNAPKPHNYQLNDYNFD